MSLVKAETIETLTKRQREDHARKVYDFDRVATLIKEAATRGDVYVRITNRLDDDEGFSRVADLHTTEAAKSLTRKLVHAGYRAAWVQTSIEERSNGKQTGAFIALKELRIIWGSVKIHSGPDESPIKD